MILNCVYRFISPSGKSYIGKTNNFNIRYLQHKKAYKNRKTKFYDACKKYDFENFKYEILKLDLNEEEMNIFEKYFITFYDSYKNGYNMTCGGDGLSKGQTQLFDKTLNKYFIGDIELIDNINIFHTGINKVTAKNIETNEIVSIDKDIFNSSDIYVGIMNNKVTAKNIETNEIVSIDKDIFNSSDIYVGITDGMTPAWDLRDNTKVFISKEEFKNNEYYVRHLRDWHSPKSLNNENSQYVWSKADYIKKLINEGWSNYKIQKEFKAKVDKIIFNLKNGWEPYEDEIWKKDFNKG